MHAYGSASCLMGSLQLRCVQDGRINYTEFAAMMRKGDPEPSNPKKRRDVVL